MREQKDPTWRVSELDVKWYRGRDHQVVNPHRSGRIEISIWTGKGNSSRTLRYFFAAGDVIENDIKTAANTPQDEKLAWFGEVLEGGVEYDIVGDVPDEWKSVARQELEWIGFTVVDESPTWHYTQD